MTNENLKTIESLGKMAESTEVRKFIRPNEAVKVYGIYHKSIVSSR